MRFFTIPFESRQVEAERMTSYKQSASDSFAWNAGRTGLSLDFVSAGQDTMLVNRDLPESPMVIGRDYFQRAYVNNTVRSSAGCFMRFAGGVDSKDSVNVWFNTSGQIEFRKGSDTGTIPGDLIATSVATFAINTWYRIELRHRPVTATTFDWEIKVDGTTVLSGSGQTITGGTRVGTTSQFDYASVGRLVDPAVAFSVKVDDWACNNSVPAAGFTANAAGAPVDVTGAQDTWPGPGHDYLLLPTVDVARDAAWIRGDGNTTALFEALNNTPPTGSASANANRIQASGAGGAAVDYDFALQTPNAVGVPADEIVRVAHPIHQTGTPIIGGIGSGMAIRLLSNPVAAEFLFNPGANNPVQASPVEWTGMLQSTLGLHMPLMDKSVAPVMRIGKRQPATTAIYADFAGLVIESGAPIDVGQSMLVGM